MKAIPWKKDSLSSTKGRAIRYTKAKKKKKKLNLNLLNKKINSKRKLPNWREHFQDLKLDEKSKQMF